MREYKFYCLDGERRLVKRLDVVCRDDLEAFKHAYDLSNDYAVEVMDGDRVLYAFGKGVGHSRTPPRTPPSRA